MNLGKMSPADALAFITVYPEATLGSLSADGMRRVKGPASLMEAFASAGGSKLRKLDSTVNERTMTPTCLHRGSKRSTCCGTPDMWICRLHKADCLESEYDKSKLIAQVQTPEAKSILCCAVCSDYATDGV